MSKSKVVFLGVVALITLAFFIAILNRNILNSQAAQSNAVVEFSPADGSDIPEDPIQMIIKPENNTEKISAVDMTIDVQNGQLVGWSGCSALNDPSIQLDDLRTDEAQGTTGRKSCGLLQSGASLPEAFIVPFTVACDGTDPVTVTINTAASQIVGPVSGQAFNITGATTATYNCAGGTLTGTPTGPVPTAEPSITPPPNTDVTAYFNPTTCSARPGETCTYNLNVSTVDPQNKISGYYVKVSYDPALMKGMDISASANNIRGIQSSGLLAQTVTCTSTADCIASPACGGNPSCLAKCDIPPGAASGVCVFANPPATSTPAPAVTVTSTPGGALSPTVVPAVSTTVTPAASPSASPSTSPIPQTSPTPNPPSVGCSVANSRINEANGTMEILYTCSSSASQLPSSVGNTIQLQALAEGTGSLEITSLQVIGPGRTQPYSTDKNSATYTISQDGGGGGKGNVELDMTLRMQCVVKKPKAKETLNVRVGLGDGPLTEPVFETGVFTVDDNGHWRGKVSFNVPPASGYKVLPKGEYHMQKKVCEENPSEDFPGAYSCDKGGITLQEGTNVLDLSNIILLTGDIPPGEQDGLSNAKDQALVRNLIGKRDAESAQLADINFDGVVNAVDHACMIAALSVRYDDQ